MRRVKAALQAGCGPGVHRVATVSDLASEWEPGLRFLVNVETDAERRAVEDLQRSGVSNLAWARSDSLQRGDVVVPSEMRSQVSVLFRETDRHHALFLTNRCNSRCLMCSQPPTEHDDGWLVDEALDAIRHLGKSPSVMGLTGGEPLLLGLGLRRVLDALAVRHPETQIEVLTNGRLFSHPHVAAQMLEGLAASARWLIPLYGHADFLHDFVVQARGAFDETLAGLLELQARGQEIQLRVVLIEPVLQVLPELAGFIGRNLPFVREVALMGCEPIGFALANREACEVNLSEWSETLERTSRVLLRHSVPHVFMNVPLCALSPSLWPVARQSISDWKNVYAPECEGCEAKADCAGLFAWHEEGWKPAPLRSMKTREVRA